jgi:hypothetical protein
MSGCGETMYLMIYTRFVSYLRLHWFQAIDQFFTSSLSIQTIQLMTSSDSAMMPCDSGVPIQRRVFAVSRSCSTMADVQRGW